ncbi:hypothetical protein [Limobrevibacterium gyesilva]|uniref:Uncharacterized protein n=1 Tax=Limobrevibacterium gyesilva TaxID=2991712 RepID=A0AA41YQP3_9PROT|nr:hypothetical protein [Limobrevibacterium gyesilva]MCW3473757.1 hypothetical protein [Limobrevibacterium gyesilva]
MSKTQRVPPPGCADAENRHSTPGDPTLLRDRAGLAILLAVWLQLPAMTTLRHLGTAAWVAPEQSTRSGFRS